MNTLYEITGRYLQLLEMMQEDEDLDQQILMDTLESIEGELEVKADGYARIIKELEADSEKYEREAKRMQAVASSRKKKADQLKKMLYESMKETGIKRMQTDLFCFSIRGNGGLKPMVIMTDAEIPEEYTEKIPDNKKIRDALERGIDLPFAALKERGEHLQIK